VNAIVLRAILSLPRTVWLIGLISLLNDLASDLSYPLVPIYLASVLMAGPRASSRRPSPGAWRDCHPPSSAIFARVDVGDQVRQGAAQAVELIALHPWLRPSLASCSSVFQDDRATTAPFSPTP